MKLLCIRYKGAHPKMSLKTIELQVALPRTQDAGKIQELLQNRGQQLIEHASEQEKKIAKAKNETVYRQENNSPVDCKKQNNSEQQEKQGQNDEAKKDHSALSQAAFHPYKGKQIDYTG